jgi:thiamine biosynthesis lipoprotein
MTSASDDPAPRPPPIDRRRVLLLLVVLAVLGAVVVARMGRPQDDGVHDFAGATMGTSFSVRIDAELTVDERGELERAARQELDRVDDLMSTYDTASDVSRFNRHASTEPIEVDPALFEVLMMAGEVAVRSGGAFDVTVAPFVDAWGFGPGETVTRAPDEATLAELRERVGYERLRLDFRNGTVAKTDPRTRIDLSGIAKGYGVERVAAALLRRGLTSFLVEVGGDLKAIGSRRDGSPWRVGIESPDPSMRGVFTTFGVVDGAVATSGDYRNFFEEDGVRYAHVIDPRTGRPIPFRDIAVSVIHDHAALADAWATALTVLGPEAGAELAAREGIAALFVTRSGDRFESRVTPAFEERVGPLAESPGS